MQDTYIKKFNHILEGLCITADALNPEFQPLFDCYIEPLNFDDNLSLNENFKHFFMINSSWKNMEKACDDPQFANWKFQMEKIGTPAETIDYFFHRNLFPTLNDQQFSVISDYLKSHIEGLIGELTYSEQGYISPPNQYIPKYVQHWQHLYLKGKDAKILITFEANT